MANDVLKLQEDDENPPKLDDPTDPGDLANPSGTGADEEDFEDDEDEDDDDREEEEEDEDE